VASADLSLVLKLDGVLLPLNLFIVFLWVTPTLHTSLLVFGDFR